MNIAILLLNQGRGSGDVARRQAKQLIDLGHTVYYMHPDVGSGVVKGTNIDITLPNDVMPVHEYLPSGGPTQKAVSTMTYAEASGYFPAYEQALETVAQDLDIIIGHHANISAVVVAKVAKKFDIPYVLFLHGTGIEPRLKGGYDDQVWQMIESAVLGAQGIIVTTEYVRDDLVLPVIPLPLEKFLILPCGIDTQEFEKSNIEGIFAKYDLPETYVICPGALTLAKGPQNVVEAAKEYADLAETIFIGGGDLQEELTQKLGSRGRFLGFVSSEDKAKLINAATLLIAAPEKLEHFGIIYVEALAGGTPVVAYEGGGVGSIVNPETGLLTARDAQTLGQCTRTLLEDPSQRAAMAEEGRKRAVALFSQEMLGEVLEKWLLGKIT